MKYLLLLLLAIPSVTNGQTLVTDQEVSTDTVMTLSSNQTITGKKTLPNLNYTILTSSSGVYFTPDSSYHISLITATGGALTIANPSGTPVDGTKMIIRVKDDGTARALTFGAIYRAGGISLPTTTVVNKTMYLGFMYNSSATKWDLLALSQGF